MDDTSRELPFLSNIGLMLTYKCTIACPHCIVEAGPHRTEEMPLEECLAWIDQARTYRDGHIKGLALTGGEPFYDVEKLSRISEYGQSLGFIVSAVTNAFWASSKDIAMSILSDLPAIRMISISTDAYHQKFIPFDRVRNLVWAALELGRFYNIAVCTDSKDDPEFRKIMNDVTALCDEDRVRVTITFPVGRAQKRAHRFHYRTSPEPTSGACSMASSPVIYPDGKVSACIGPVLTLPPDHPLFLGNLQEETLQEILDRAEVNPVLHAIRVWGPQKLVSHLKQHGLEAILPGEYICDCLCDVCYRLLSDKRIVDALEDIMEDTHTRQLLAYARLYYLNESTMIGRYPMDTAESVDRIDADTCLGAESIARKEVNKST